MKILTKTILILSILLSFPSCVGFPNGGCYNSPFGYYGNSFGGYNSYYSPNYYRGYRSFGNLGGMHCHR
jgi:hypothetical protein